MNGVKVTKTVLGAIQVGQDPRHVCLTEGVCLVARVNTGSAVQQQCSSAADEGWRFVPHAILLGHWRAPSPAKDTHGTLGPGQREGRRWPVKIRRQTHGKHGSGAGC